MKKNLHENIEDIWDELFYQLVNNHVETLDNYLLLLENNSHVINFEKEDGLPQKRILQRVFRLMSAPNELETYLFFETIAKKLIDLGAEYNIVDGMGWNIWEHAKRIDKENHNNFTDYIRSLDEAKHLDTIIEKPSKEIKKIKM
jgi:hypothetical protein